MTKELPSGCLDAATLRQLAHDELEPAELVHVEEHVSSCLYCQRTLESNASDHEGTSSILAILRSDREDSFDDACPDGVKDGRQLDSVLKLLGPTDDPHNLGRIGTYEIVGVIGRGGMGIVLKAFDAPLNRFVAIKLLLPHLAESGAARMRFAREGQAAAAVIDDNVLPIHSVAEWRGVPYLVMQYSRGSTLQKRIHQQGPLEIKEILRIGLHTARGLAAAHSQGLVHRDVKPSNILLDGTVDRAMLTDFGLARAVDDANITCTGVIAGTPHYMSPEQARGDAIDARSDLFSLGSVMYAMCTGRPPFRAESSFGVLRRITDTEPRPITEINADIPTWLAILVEKLLAKEPVDRIPTAIDVAKLLEQCLAHVQQPSAVPLPAICKLKPVARQRPVLLITACICLLAVGLTLLYFGNKWGNRHSTSANSNSGQDPRESLSIPAPSADFGWDPFASEIAALDGEGKALEQRTDQLWNAPLISKSTNPAEEPTP